MVRQGEAAAVHHGTVHQVHERDPMVYGKTCSRDLPLAEIGNCH